MDAGAINPSLTVEVSPVTIIFRTSCVRDGATTGGEKNGTYAWYAIKKPKTNVRNKQTCELDHLISIELGGADTLDNIWPQCGPAGVVGARRYLHQKDLVENWLAREVRGGRMALEVAQRGIAADWTQFIARAEGVYAEEAHRAEGLIGPHSLTMVTAADRERLVRAHQSSNGKWSHVATSVFGLIAVSACSRKTD